MKNRSGAVVLLAVVATALPFAALANGSNIGHHGNFFAALSGGQEVPAVSTPARGKALVRIGPSITAAGDGATLQYVAGWDGLEGDVLQAHIHFGARGTNGGVIAFLCSNLNASPPGLEACPQRGIIHGQIGADAILGPDGQGIAPGEIGEVVRALREGLVYVNVHTSEFPGGEIRGQVQRRFGIIDTQLDPTVADVEDFLGTVDIRSR